MKIESAVEILSGDPSLSGRAVADFPVRVTAAISFWHDGRLHVCGGHSEYPAQEPDRKDSIFVSALIDLCNPTKLSQYRVTTVVE